MQEGGQSIIQKHSFIRISKLFDVRGRITYISSHAKEAAAYPKLFKIYKELKRQNETIFEAEKERNALELERDDLKGFARFTKKGGPQSKIDRKNEEIDILKIGLSGIAKRYGYQNVQEFYKIYHKAHTYIAYRDQATEWEKRYREDNRKQNKKAFMRS